MGMYTEFHFYAELNKDVPKSVLDILMYMENPREMEHLLKFPLPDHKLFLTERWHYLMVMDSYYFPSQTSSKLHYDDLIDTWYLNINSNIKNYSQEITHFVDWIRPYVYEHDTEHVLGYSQYEEGYQITLHFKDKDITLTPRKDLRKDPLTAA